jgi:CDP-6-deoxy-D-xylo-4-hexulose-3-dehydrase
VTTCYYPTAISGWDSQEVDAIHEVIKSDRYTMGYQCEALEKEFAAYHGMKYGIGTNSGSSANLISIAAMVELGILERGTALTVPALAWSTTFAPIVQYGLGIVLIDSDSTWNAYRAPDVVVSILGNAQHKPGQPVLCDNCESVGARDETGTLSGTQGICNTFSFFFSHQMSAIEGGMILTNDEDVVRMCRKLRAHGWTRDTRIAQEFSDEYRFEVHGFNVRPQEINSAIARVQLRKLDARIAARSANYNHWVSATDGLPLLHPAIRGTPSFFGIHFCVASKDVRAKLAKALRAVGIDCRPPVAGSFRRQPYGAKWADQKTPNADAIHDTGMFIGNPPEYRPDLIDHAVSVMREVL